MRYAIFSDVQGNYDALVQFFEETKDHTDQYFCLGDIVQNGTNFEDNRCIELVRNICALTVRGNHEDDVLTNIEKARKKISSDNLEYLSDLPETLIIKGKYYLTHAFHNRRILTRKNIKKKFTELASETEICFFGHTHKAIIYSQNKKGVIKEEKIKNEPLILNEDEKYMVNPGGVGLYWGALKTYVLFDEEARTFQVRELGK